MYNKVTLIGRLGKDPEVRSLDENTKVAKFTMATNESYKDKSGEWQDKTEWHNIVAWRGLADRIERNLSTGMLVFVEGKITYRKYTDKDGVDRYITDVVAYTVKPLEKRDDPEKSGDSSRTPTFETTEKAVGEKTEEGSSDKEDDDLPF
jgi:single-strand DNA-binding protein